MAITGPIILIEDDSDDQEFVEETLGELGIINKVIIFNNCKDVIPYLMSTTDKPFIIISDVNIPGMTGIELRRQINENDFLRKKSIPFVFFSTTARPDAVAEAYHTQVQGYFEKPNNLKDLRKMIQVMIEYWKICKHPNSL